MSIGLTRKQHELLTFIRDYLAANEDVSPSFDEMMVALGLRSKSGVHRLVEALIERGQIRRIPNRARTLVPVEGGAFEHGHAVGYAEGFQAGLLHARKVKRPALTPTQSPPSSLAGIWPADRLRLLSALLLTRNDADG